MFLRIVRSSGEMQDYRISALKLRKSPKNPSLVLELVIRKSGTNYDDFSQPTVRSDSRQPLGHSRAI